MKKLLIVFGTRPEAIKLAPLILKAKKDPRFQTVVVSTGQHREMLKPILSFFGITPDFDLNLMKPGQSLTDISSGVLQRIDLILKTERFDGVVVQGDTASCFIASLVAFYHRVPVIHVEAGLRSGDIQSPFPEEFNRKATGLVAKFHFAPTETSKSNLLREHFPEEDIFVTGNTGIDALFEVKHRLSNTDHQKEFQSKYSFLSPQKKLALVTVHRRESFGTPMEEILKGVLTLSRRQDLEVLIPVHMNPEVRASVEKIFKGEARWMKDATAENSAGVKIWLCEPADYVSFVYLMDRAHVIITDSGGVQEEAPSLGKPVLVARENTERPEGILAGTSKLIPLQEQAFLKSVEEVLDNPEIYQRMAQAQNPFGDGTACEKILTTLADKL